MATWYVDGVNGLDTNAGTSTGAAFASIGKALTSLGSGDTVYVAVATYRELLKPTVAATSTVSVIADTNGRIFGRAGEVQVTAYLVNDTTAASTTDALIDCNGLNFYSYTGFTFIGSNYVNASLVYAGSSVHDWTFTDCTFIDAAAANSRKPINFAAQAADLTSNISFNRCIIVGNSNVSALSYVATLSATAEYDIGLTVSECLFINYGNSAIDLSTTGANTAGRPGGGYVKGCTFVGGAYSANTFGAIYAHGNWSYSNPARAVRCYVPNYSGGPPIAVGAGSVGISWEDGSIAANDPSTAIYWLVGSISQYAKYAPRVNVGQDRTWRPMRPRRVGEPEAGSFVLGFCPFAEVSIGIPGTATDDSTIGTVSWTNPNNALVVKELAGQAYATAAMTNTAISHYLKLTNWAFHPTLPSTAVILGLRIELAEKASVGSDVTFDSVKFYDGVGAAYQSEWVSHVLPVNTGWGTIDQHTQFGSSSQLWGYAAGGLTPTILNNAGSGIGLAVTSSGTATAEIDGVRMFVYWYDPSNMPVDLLNIQRPCGGGSANFAAGCYELHNTAVRASAHPQASTYYGQIVGPGDQEILVPVDAVSHSVSIYLRYDSPYAGNRPTVTMLEGVAAGAAQTITATTGANGAWEQEVFSAISPSAPGVVRLRIQSFDTNGSGLVGFDTAG